MLETFTFKDFKDSSLETIRQAIEIIDEYQEQGYILTLRQLYYQFVARALCPNTTQEYKRLGGIVSDARLAGLIDWDSIEDRTRKLEKNLHLRSPMHAIELIRAQYLIDMWSNQTTRVEVWIEKQALTGIIEEVCDRLDVPYFACRGYVSQSEQYSAGKRMARNYEKKDQYTVILHLGDHDPSGMDMTRDNFDRLNMFVHGQGNVDVVRIALNMDQVEEYSPPPNPVKLTDSRSKPYQAEYGDESWELDALEPSMLVQLIEDHVLEYRDEELWEEREKVLARDTKILDDMIDSLD